MATIKPADPHVGVMRLGPTLNGFSARGVTLFELVREAYAAYEDGRVEGGPAWLNKTKFDVDAKFDESEVPQPRDLTLKERRAALRTLLTRRFKMSAHCVERDLKAYALQMTKKEANLRQIDPATLFDGGFKGADSVVTVSQAGHLEGHNFTMAQLAKLLESQAGRVIVDQTGNTNRFDFLLRWAPDEPARAPSAGSNQPAEEQSVYPSFPTALQEQLSLKLIPIKAPVQIVLIDHAEPPSKNWPAQLQQKPTKGERPTSRS